MSKIYTKYLELKKDNPNFLYLFKSGIFFIFVDEDAKKIHETLHLKLCPLNDSIVKCGFPNSHLTTYLNLIASTNYKIKIVENFTSSEPKDYINNSELTKLMQSVSKIHIDDLSVGEAFNLLYKIQNKFIEII